MLLSELAEAVTNYLNAQRSEWAPETVVAKTELDPDKMLINGLGVYIVPITINYSSDGVAPRGGIIPIQRALRLALVISRVFSQLPTMGSDGVTNWEEAKIMLDTTEKAEKVIMGFQTSALTLIDVEPNPIEELELDHRNFVCLTSFAWQEVECESPLGLRTLSNGLNILARSGRIMLLANL